MYYYRTSLFEKMITDLAVSSIRGASRINEEVVGNSFLMFYKDELERVEHIPSYWEKTLDFMERKLGKFRSLTRKNSALAVSTAKKTIPVVARYLLLVKAKEEMEKLKQKANEKNVSEKIQNGLKEIDERLQLAINEMEKGKLDNLPLEVEEAVKFAKEAVENESDDDIDIAIDSIHTTSIVLEIPTEDELKEDKKKIETFQSLLGGRGGRKPSEEENIAIGLVYENLNDSTLQYLGDLLENIGQKTKSLEVDPTSTDYGSDIDRIRIESVYDELIFEQRLAEDNLVIKGLEEDVHVGYGTFVMCLDTSSSMDGVNIDKAKALALFYGLQAVSRGITFAIVPFNSYAKDPIVVNSRRNIADFIRSVAGLSAAGGTKYGPAINKAVEVASSFKKKADLLFISDGQPSDAPRSNTPDIFHTKVFVGVDMRISPKWEKFFDHKIFVNSENFHKATATDIENIQKLGGMKP
ncbi:VWA domain-containing protein [Persephonella sp.]